jgi:NAD(P)-dependent dehydrogenase (short-subunit alcohol dehydrogenase family)
MLHPALEAHHSAYKGRTICITGGAGFIGSHIADTLVECGATVRILDDFSNGRESNLQGPASAAKVIRGSICDDAVLNAAFAGAEIVFHQAAMDSLQGAVRLAPDRDADPCSKFAASQCHTDRNAQALKCSGLAVPLVDRRCDAASVVEAVALAK